MLLKIPLWQEFNPHQAGNQTATTTTFIHTIQVEEEEGKKYRRQNNRRYIIIYTIFELVCNSQSSKAFELTAAYLQVKKGRKETDNNYD